MKFYDRETEITILRKQEENSSDAAQMTKLVESKQFSAIGSYWDRKGESEIDIVAVNELEKKLIFYEVKRNEKRINLQLLEQKAAAIAGKYPDFHIEYKKLAMNDM